MDCPTAVAATNAAATNPAMDIFADTDKIVLPGCCRADLSEQQLHICGASLRWADRDICPYVRVALELVFPHWHVEVHHLIPFGVADARQIKMRT